MTTASPGVVHSALGVLATAWTEVGDPIDDAWDRLVLDLTDAEVAMLPDALATVAPLLEADRGRRRLALDILVTLDLYEAAVPLTELAVRDPDYALAAAALAPHPGNSAKLVQRLRRLSASGSRTWPELQRQAFEIRLTPSAAADGRMATALRFDRWPGATNADPGRRTVLVHPSVGSAAESSALLSGLHRLGVRVRRAPSTWQRKSPQGWIDSMALVVAPSGSALAELRNQQVPVTPDHLIVAHRPLSPAERHRIVDEVARRIGSPREYQLAPPGEESPLAPGVFRSGAFDNHEMAYLGGVRHGVPQSVRAVLAPRKIGAINYWDFSQLVALRCWQYFKSTTGRRRFPVDLVENLTSIARSQEETIVGVTATGNVLYEVDGSFVDARTNETMPPELVVPVDAVFQPIKLGAGAVPPLLAPSLRTRVHPETLAGTPTLAGRRIPVRAVAAAARDDVRMAQRAYPELTPEELHEALVIGRQLLSA